MLSLLLDSSDKKLAVAICNDYEVLTFRYYDAWQRQSEYMINEIDTILSDLNIHPLDINQIIVSVGPGSYTGVRISLTIAKIWGFCRDIKVFAISSLEILKDENKDSICLINARSNRSYVGIYLKDGSVKLKDCILTNDEILGLIQNNDYEVCGDTSYLNIKGNENNIFMNMLHISKNIKPVEDILSLKAVYLKDN